MIRRVVVNDVMQKGYRYLCTQPVGKHFEKAFQPDLTPAQMLKLGVFGGKYMSDKPREFPRAWFRDAKLSHSHHEPTYNYFGVNASQPLVEWRKKGWIHKDDPRGWFQWYCRYYMGRRGADDVRQIKRWKAMRRHIGQIIKHCRKGDTSCHARQRQALLHWAYDSRTI